MNIQLAQHVQLVQLAQHVQLVQLLRLAQRVHAHVIVQLLSSGAQSLALHYSQTEWAALDFA